MREVKDALTLILDQLSGRNPSFFFEIVTALNSILFKSFPSVFAISKQAMNILKQQLVLGVLMEKRPTPPPMSEALVHDVVFRGRLFFGEKSMRGTMGPWGLAPKKSTEGTKHQTCKSYNPIGFS